MNQKSIHNCLQCGSSLILISRATEKLEGSRFPQTTSAYRCSNKQCQDEKDKEKAKRLKILKERELAYQKRSFVEERRK